MPNDTHPRALSNLHLDLTVTEDLGDLADDAPGGDNAVTTAQGLDHGAMLLHLLLLRTNQQEVKHHKNQNDRQQRHQNVATTTASRLRIGRRNQHARSSVKPSLNGQTAGRKFRRDYSRVPMKCNESPSARLTTLRGPR